MDCPCKALIHALRSTIHALHPTYMYTCNMYLLYYVPTVLSVHCFCSLNITWGYIHVICTYCIMYLIIVRMVSLEYIVLLKLSLNRMLHLSLLHQHCHLYDSMGTAESKQLSFYILNGYTCSHLNYFTYSCPTARTCHNAIWRCSNKRVVNTNKKST